VLACLRLHREASTADLVALAQDFSPRFEVVSADLVVVDVAGLERLVGDGDAVGAAIDRVARARGLSVTVTIAPTRTTAMLLALAGTLPVRRARAGATGPAYRLVAPGEIAAVLAPLPVSVLAALQRVETAASEERAPAPARGARQTSRTRGSGRNYRLAPHPGSARPRKDSSRHDARSADSAPATLPADGAVDRAVDRDSPLSDLLATLQRWGVQTLGAFAALPTVDLFERLGSAGPAWQAAARGEDTRPLVRTSPEDPFEATAALEWPLDTLEPLSFVVSGLLEPLCLRLERAERGAAVLQTTLQLVSRTLHVRTLELPAPMRDVKVLRTLILLDLESHPPDAGIDRVTITIAPTPGRIVQHSLLARARPSPEQVATLTARLIAVLGESRVGAPALVDSFEPGAFTLQPFDGDAVSARESLAAAGSTTSGDPPASAVPGATRPQTGFVLRRFRRLLPVRVERVRGRPVHVAIPSGGPRGGRIVQAAGPWRTSGAWWTAVGSQPGAGSPEPTDCAWDRDEWDVVIADGTALRLSCNRETGQWCIEGVLD
jgi:protein ImuB